MNCKYCDAELQPGETFCTNCGNNLEENAPAVVDPGAGKGKVALILGIVAVALNAVCSCLFSCLGSVPGFICAAIAIVMSILAMNESKAAGFKNKNATIGLILGIVAIVLALVFIVLNMFLGGAMGAIMSSSGY